MITGHRDVDASVFRKRPGFDVAHGTKAQMRRQVVFLAAGRLAGVAPDAVVGREMKRMLLGAVGIEANAVVAVDLQAGTVVVGGQ